MHIAKRTPDLLVLTDTGATPRSIGAILIAVGALFVYTGSQASSLQFTPVIVGALAALAGIAFVVLPGRVIAAFDRPSHTLIITRRTLKGATRDEVDFSKIADVTAESSTVDNGGGTYRVAIVLKDRARIPLTPWYTSSPLHAAAAAAADDFLGLAATPATSPPSTSLYRPVFGLRRTQHAQSRGSVGCAALLCAIFFAVGAAMLFTLWSRLTTWRPVNAVVVMSDVTAVHGTKSTSYRPDVSYRYQVDGRQYYGMRTTILNESRSSRWAYGVIRRYPAGAEVMVYVDPANPARSYLLHEWSFFPFIFTGVPLVMVAFLLWTLRQMPKTKPDGAAPPGTVAPGSGTT